MYLLRLWGFLQQPGLKINFLNSLSKRVMKIYMTGNWTKTYSYCNLAAFACTSPNEYLQHMEKS